MSGIVWVAAHGARLPVEVRGDGRDVVCLHAGIADRRMWSRQDPGRLGRLIAFDRRGFGDAVAGDEPWSPVGDALAILDALGIGVAALVGCSQGGRIALDLALAHPERVGALVLVAPAVSGAPSLPDPPELEAAYEAAEQSGDPERLNAFEVRLWVDGAGAPEGRVVGDLRELALDMNRRALQAVAGPPQFPGDTWDRLGALAVPTLVVWGDLDLPSVIARSEQLVTRIPGARGHCLAGTAHLLNLESPERFDPVVAAFLDEVLTGA